jgi:hypothetical protein
MHASTTTDAASAETPLMEQEPAEQSVLDPRQVVTPLIASKLEELLYKYNIYEEWEHMISSIKEGFDIGVKESPKTTLSFREPCIFTTKHRYHRPIYNQ